MAHYTGLSKLQNRPHRSGFDISSKNCFTAKCGELLPVYWDLGIPNCTYDINLQYFTRTRPVQTAAYTRVREYFDFYAVSLDLIWKSFDTSVIQMGEVAPVQSKDLLNSLIVQGDLPYCSLYDISNALLYQNGNVATGGSVSVARGYESIHGFNRGDLSHKLLHMLDYGNVVFFNSGEVGTSTNRFWNRSAPLPSSLSGTYSQKYRQNLIVNIFPLAAYQKIYQDFFRWSQWENADPTSYNFDWYSGSGSIFSRGLSAAIPAANDYWKRDNLFSLRYCNWNKDKFMGMLPNSQFGDVALINFGEDGSGLLTVGLVSDLDEFNPIFNSTVLTSPSDTSGISTAKGGSAARMPLMARFTSSDQNSFSILALRQAEALQKYREITQSVDTNYRDQIKAHFGVNVPASDSHMAQYIGGIARNLDISEVVNNNLYEDGSQAVIYGKGVGTGSSGGMRYSTGSQYCILMCVYHCIPLLDYNISAPKGQLLATSVEELPIPEFDSIGMESVPSAELFNTALFGSVGSSPNFLGYNPRYYNWKTDIDRIHGAFTTTLMDWVAPIDDAYLSKWFHSATGNSGVQWPFFKVNPATLDRIFGVEVDSTWETDQFLVNAALDVKVVRPLSHDGVPY